jgi:hypothetical protein
MRVCRILTEMADAFFSFSWRILEPYGSADLLCGSRMLALEPRRGGIPKRGSRGARIRHSDSGLHDVVEDRPSVNFSPSGTCEPVADIGALRAADKILRVYNNGTPKSGNLAAVTFGRHDAIAIVYGFPRPGESIPPYDFPVGD